jgi:hypothetical protein
VVNAAILLGCALPSDQIFHSLEACFGIRPRAESSNWVRRSRSTYV